MTELAELLRDPPPPRYPAGVFTEHAARVAPPSDGAVTRP
jgi:hypothetical protein